MAETLYFQWQDEVLCKTIYPMRLNKLRDFLVYYKEVDLWAEYKNKDISTLQADVQAYEKGMQNARSQSSRNTPPCATISWPAMSKVTSSNINHWMKPSWPKFTKSINSSSHPAGAYSETH